MTEEEEEAIAYGRRVIDLGLNDETQAFCELAIKALEQQSYSWIPVSKRLPKSGENVLFRTKDGTVFEGRYFNYIGSDRQWYSSRYDKFEYNNYVMAWMPVEPYKESEDKND